LINLSERQALILELLRDSSQPITSRTLSGLVGVSVRTLRYDVGTINRRAQQPVVLSSSAGYAVDRSVYRETFAGRQRILGRRAADEQVLVYLLDRSESSLYDVANECYMSEGAVVAALKRLTPYAAGHQLDLQISGSTVALLGSEKDRRRLLGSLIRNAMNTEFDDGHQRLARLLPDASLEAVHNMVIGALAPIRQSNDIGEQNLAVNIAICLQRAAFADDVPPAHPATGDQLQQIGARLLDEIEHRFPSRPLAASDRAYVLELLRNEFGDGTPTLTDVDTYSTDEVLRIVRSAVEETLLHFELDAQREELVIALTNHVRRLLARNAGLLYFRNALREPLRTRSPLLYDAAVYLAHALSRELSAELTDDEIGLLAVHLGMHTGHDGAAPRALRAVVVCPQYQALRERLVGRLRERFGDDIAVVQVVSRTEDSELADADLVISVLPQEPASNAPVAFISPLCSAADLDTVANVLNHARQRRDVTEARSTLSRFLDPALFFVGGSYPDAESTIRFLAGKLIDSGTVPDTYLESVLLREEYSSTAFAHRFAVPHSMELLANETRIAVLLPQGPVAWGQAEVALVLMLAVSPRDYHRFGPAYQSLIHSLSDAEVFSSLLATTDLEGFMSALHD